MSPGSGWRLLSDPRLVSLATQGLIVALTLFPAVAVARDLGPAGAGTYALGSRIAALTLSASSLSLAHGIAQVATNRGAERAGQAWASGLCMCIPQGILAIMLALVATKAASPHAPGEFTLLIVLAIPFQLATLVGAHVLRGSMYVAEFNVQRLLQAIVWAAAFGVSWLHGSKTLTDIGIAWLLTQIVTSLWVCWRVARKVGVHRPKFHGSLSFGLRAHLGIVSRDASSYLDQLLIGVVAGTSSLGLYVPASLLGSMVTLLANNMALTMQPQIGRAEPGQVRSTVARLLREGGIVTLPVALVLALSAQYLVPAIYGDMFVLSGKISAGLCLAAGFDAILVLSIAALLGLDAPGIATLVQLGTTIGVTLGYGFVVSEFGIAVLGWVAPVIFGLAAVGGLCSVAWTLRRASDDEAPSQQVLLVGEGVNE